MKNTLLALLVCLVSVGFAQQKKSLAPLDKKLDELLKATKTAGYAVAIVKGDKLIHAKGFGYSDYETKTKVDENTLFAVGSTSKAFTTALLGILREKHKFSFSDHPKTLLPKLKFFNEELNTKLTLVDIISHRTGLPRHDLSWYLFPTEDKDSLLARIQHHEPFTGLRQQWYYNNFMYLTQGMIAEELTKKSWEENIRENFFGPLEMKRSNLNITDLQKSTNFSKGYKLLNHKTITKTDYFNIAAISPAGSINSSVSEMANWLKVWINGGKFNGQQILPAAYVQEAINPYMLVGKGIANTEFADQHLNSYGYAWFISSYKSHYRVEHGGNIDGFSANVSFFPSDSIGIVVLTNQDNSMLPTLARNTIADYLLDVNATDWIAYYNKKKKEAMDAEAKAKTETISNRVPNTQASHTLTEYTGSYTQPGYGTFSIEFKNDSLVAVFPVQRMYLQHWHYDVFRPYMFVNGLADTNEFAGFNFNFKTNDLGDIEGVNLKLEGTLDPVLFERTPSTVALTEDQLKIFAGNYYLGEVAIKVEQTGNQLTLTIPQQPTYALVPVSETEFLVKGLSGYKVNFDKTLTAQKLVITQPNGVFTANKK